MQTIMELFTIVFHKSLPASWYRADQTIVSKDIDV